MPPESSLGNLVGVALHVEADLGDPLAGLLAPLGRRHAATLEAEGDVVLDAAVVERGVVLKHHAPVRAGALDRLAAHQHRALGGGNCGRSPAISRSTVDLPQPEGPRIAMNSPLSGTSGTENVTSRMTVCAPKRLVTFAEVDDVRHDGGRARSPSLLDGNDREKAALEPEQQPVDAERQQTD